MNQNSPGRMSTESDIEMIEVDDIAPSQKPHQNGYGQALTQEPESDDDDEPIPIHRDDTHRGLLSGSIQKAYFEASPSKLWPQVKGIVIESAPTLLMTTISLLFTGKLLDKVSHWRAMQEVDQLIMIVPVVLNLNGNLEMNLSARLGTAANVGELDEPSVRTAIILGSLALLQVQTISVSFLAACIALILGRVVPRAVPQPIPSAPASTNSTAMAIRDALTYSLQSRETEVARKSGFPTLIMVASTTMVAASLSGVILGSLMCSIIIICRKFDRDPDNIAPAVASCLGDLFTLILLGIVSTILVPFIRTPIPFIVGILVICCAITCFLYTWKNPYVRPLLKEGWSPLFGAMAISSGTGIVLDMFVSRYEGFAVLAVVISGLPGAAGSILVSRLSTALHAAKLALENALPTYSTPSKHPEPSPFLTTITLLLITLPVEVIFLSILNGLGWLNLPFLFVVFSITFFCCALTSYRPIFYPPSIFIAAPQVFASLVIARLLTNFLWSKNRDPDLYALPIHSALMDLIGQLLLVLCFEIVSRLGVRVRVKPPAT